MKISAISDLLIKPIESNTVDQMNVLLSRLTNIELAQIHGFLEFDALEKLNKLANELNLSLEAKEHIAYKYYLLLTNQQQNAINTELLLEIIEVYKETSYNALESLLILLLKEDKIHYNDVAFLKKIDSKTVKKEIFLRSIRVKISNKQIILYDEVLELLNLNQYKILEDILDKNLLEKETLCLFINLNDEEKFKKSKKKLAMRAQKLLDS